MEKTYKLVIFDVDGTLVKTKSGATFRKDAADWQWLPGRLDKLRELKAQGVRLAVASNQGGVAHGHLTKDGILSELLRMCKEAGIPLGGLYICYNMPNAQLEEYRHADHRRKSAPGMLLEAMQDFEVGPEETLMVGDRDEDAKAAFNAHCDFLPARIFFGDPDVIVAPVTGFV